MRFTIATLARPVADIDFAEITDATRTGDPQWVEEGVLDIPFDRELTQAEADAVALRLTTPNDTVLEGRQACVAYMALATPTTAQNTAQIRALTGLLLELLGGQR